MAYCVTLGLLVWAAILYFVFNQPGASVVCVALAVAWVVAKVFDRVYEAIRNG